MTSSRWVHEFPTRGGLYWFVGERYARNEYSKKMGALPCIEFHFCFVRKIRDGVMVLAEGQFMYERELGDEWYFCPVEVPKDLPSFAEGSDMSHIESMLPRNKVPVRVKPKAKIEGAT